MGPDQGRGDRLEGGGAPEGPVVLVDEECAHALVEVVALHVKEGMGWGKEVVSH